MMEPVKLSDEILEELKQAKDPLDEESLKLFIGGQAMMVYPTYDRLVGNIEDISAAAGCVEISCPWVAHMRKRCRTWYFDPRRTEVGFLTVQLRGDWEQSDRGLVIFGVVGNMILHPNKEWFVSRSDVRDS